LKKKERGQHAPFSGKGGSISLLRRKVQKSSSTSRHRGFEGKREGWSLSRKDGNRDVSAAAPSGEYRRPVGTNSLVRCSGKRKLCRWKKKEKEGNRGCFFGRQGAAKSHGLVTQPNNGLSEPREKMSGPKKTIRCGMFRG